jgi:tetratricopeptide (TPR) repeat protein
VIRVHPDSEDPRVEYGLEVDDGVHRLRILFGSRDSIERLSDGTVVIRQSAALHQWSDQTVDLSSIYGQIGWTLPPLVHDIYRGLDTDLRLVLLRLVLSVNGRQGNWQAYFGPITQPDYSPDPRTLMAETLDNPGDYYVRLAEFYVRGRNYALALEAYRTALEYAPDSSRARDGLKSVEQRLTEEGNK